MGDLVKKDWISPLKNNGFVKYIRSRVSSFILTDDLIVRMRIILFLTSLLAFYLALPRLEETEIYSTRKTEGASLKRARGTIGVYVLTSQKLLIAWITVYCI